MRMQTVEPMQKVIVAMSAGRGPEDEPYPLSEARAEFVYGIGTGGMTPFEYLLAGRAQGDRVHFWLERSDQQRFFAHLPPPALFPAAGHERVYVTARIERIEKAQSREIIKAMAEAAAQGGEGCDCGWGCG
jgi:hypothetical protein